MMADLGEDVGWRGDFGSFIGGGAGTEEEWEEEWEEGEVFHG